MILQSKGKGPLSKTEEVPKAYIFENKILSIKIFSVLKFLVNKKSGLTQIDQLNNVTIFRTSLTFVLEIARFLFPPRRMLALGFIILHAWKDNR